MRDDSLNAARGVAAGVVLGVVLWVMLGAAATMLRAIL